MTDDDKPYYWLESYEDAEAHGIDPEHLFEHLVETVLCVSGGDERVFDLGFYCQFNDLGNRVWTLSLVPEDGGVISDALLESAFREES